VEAGGAALVITVRPHAWTNRSCEFDELEKATPGP
jgi:hypothetical protein